MRIFVTGVDGQGRSCILEHRSPDDPPSAAGITVTFAAETTSSPPPPRPPGRGDLVPIVRGPGIARWSFVVFPPRVGDARRALPDERRRHRDTATRVTA
jgi:hypothetical protein